MPKRYALVVTSSEHSSLGTSTQQRVSLIRLYHIIYRRGFFAWTKEPLSSIYLIK